MSRLGKILLSLATVSIVAGFGVAMYALASHAASRGVPTTSGVFTTAPGLSLAGGTACEDFLHETQPGGRGIIPQDGKITQQAVKDYLHANVPADVKLTGSWYYDCGKRTFYYIELTGAFYPRSSPSGYTPQASSHEYLLFDAKTGNILRTGTGN